MNLTCTFVLNHHRLTVSPTPHRADTPGLDALAIWPGSVTNVLPLEVVLHYWFVALRHTTVEDKSTLRTVSEKQIALPVYL